MTKIERAHQYALKVHGDQKYGICPYSKHLGDVVSCLERFGFDHQIAKDDPFVEDTKATTEEIAELFGQGVSDIVHWVTDEKGDTRGERKASTYPKIRGHLGATVVKLADRIANVESSILENEKHFLKYVDEHQEFYESVFVPEIAEPMWSHLQILIESEFGDDSHHLKNKDSLQMTRPS
jgi:(p)ppGpp synthase/HD superfamily hydrolase